MTPQKTKTRHGNISKIVTTCRATGSKVTRYEVKFRKKMQDGTVVDYQKRFDSLREAEAEKATVLAAIAAGTYQPPARTKPAATEPESQAATVAQGLGVYIKFLKKTKPFGLGSRQEEELQTIAKRPIGQCLLADLSGSDLDDYVEARRTDGVAGATIRKEVALLKRFRRVAHELNLGVAPGAVRQSIRLPHGEARTRRPQGDELMRLLAWLEKHDQPTYWGARLAITTACRQQELATARWADFDEQQAVLWLAASQTKTKRQRGVPLLSEALQILATIPRSLGNRADLILGGISPYGICTGWRRACKACGVEGLRFHDLRREAISRFASLGLADRQLMLFSGHTQASMLSVYTVLNPAQLGAQVRQLEAKRAIS